MEIVLELSMVMLRQSKTSRFQMTAVNFFLALTIVR